MAHGSVIVQGGCFCGWSLHVNGGAQAYHDNSLGLQQTAITASEKLPVGKSTIRFEFTQEGGGLAKVGKGTLFVNVKKVGEETIPRARPVNFSADETADVSIDWHPRRRSHRFAAKVYVHGSASGVTVEVK